MTSPFSTLRSSTKRKIRSSSIAFLLNSLSSDDTTAEQSSPPLMSASLDTSCVANQANKRSCYPSVLSKSLDSVASKVTCDPTSSDERPYSTDRTNDIASNINVANQNACNLSLDKENKGTSMLSTNQNPGKKRPLQPDKSLYFIPRSVTRPNASQSRTCASVVEPGAVNIETKHDLSHEIHLSNETTVAADKYFSAEKSDSLSETSQDLLDKIEQSETNTQMIEKTDMLTQAIPVQQETCTKLCSNFDDVTKSESVIKSESFSYRQGNDSDEVNNFTPGKSLLNLNVKSSALPRVTWSDLLEEGSTLQLLKTTRYLYSNVCPNNYLKGCKWSPDGLALATSSKDKTLRIFNFPDFNSPSEQAPVAVYHAPSALYDFVWNPSISHLNVASCNMAVSSKNSPIHLLDAFSGSVLGNYVAFNQVEEMISAFSVCYLSDTKILAGYCKHVRQFDLNRPGKEASILSVGDRESQNNNSIVSTLATHPTMNMFAAGCYNNTLALYSPDIRGPVVPFAAAERGITHLMFSKDGRQLFTGYRLHDEMHCFDTRYSGLPLYSLPRLVRTNQRIYFDMSPDETVLLSGNNNGDISLYDVSWDDEKVGGRIRNISVHGDTVNGVAIHPRWRFLATTSGQRRFGDEDAGDYSLRIWRF